MGFDPRNFLILTAMESRYLAFPILVLLSIALVGESHARAQLADEDYWKAIWPNTPIPDNLRDLLKLTPSGVVNNDAPMTIGETQFPVGYFFNNDLYPGKTMNAQFSMHPFTQGYGIVPWDQNDVKDIEKDGGFSREELCLNKGPNTEDKYCTESLRTLMDYVISKLGKNIEPLSSSFLSKQVQYKVEGVTYVGEKAVMCHRLNFQKATFYCHEVHGTTTYTLPLVASDGTKTHALAVCHFDTTGFNKQLFRQVMKVDPGTNPICHFLGNKSILWVSNSVHQA